MSENPLEDIAEGAAKGATEAVLDYTDRKLSKWIKKFKHKKIFFTNDPKIIELIEEQEKQREWIFFKNCVKDKKLRVLFRMGLVLRTLEKNHKNFSSLAKKILKRHGLWGLHVAQFVQNGLFSKYIGVILEKMTEENLESEIIKLFYNIDDTVLFIKSENKTDIKAQEIIAKIHAHSPGLFIISSVGEAVSNCEQVKDSVMKLVSSDYACELYDLKGKRIYFLNRIHDII